jgi:hypothetical protein
MMRLNTPLTQIDTTALYTLGSRVQDKSCNEYIYLKGIGSTLVGSWVTYDELGITALLVAEGKGPVAVSLAHTVANTYGWYQISGLASALIAADSAADTNIGRETADGYAGDGRAAGDFILRCIQRGSTAGGAAALADVQIKYPLVNDCTG